MCLCVEEGGARRVGERGFEEFSKELMRCAHRPEKSDINRQNARSYVQIEGGSRTPREKGKLHAKSVGTRPACSVRKW